MIIGGLLPQALPQYLFQGDGAPVLLQQVAERLLCQLLQGDEAVLRQAIQRQIGPFLEGYPPPHLSTVCCH
jgi:hypothetical protein